MCEEIHILHENFPFKNHLNHEHDYKNSWYELPSNIGSTKVLAKRNENVRTM